MTAASPKQEPPSAGQKRKEHPSSPPDPKRGKVVESDKQKDQATIEESIGLKMEDKAHPKTENGDLKNGNEATQSPTRSKEKASNEHQKKDTATSPKKGADNAERDPPPSLLEKGILYFFTRPRVNVDEPHAVADIARTFLVMRPIPLSASLSDTAAMSDESAANRLIALPKKVFPRDESDKFMIFTEKAPASLADLKLYLTSPSAPDSNASSVPACLLAGEGVYTLSSLRGTTHLSYKLTLPDSPSTLQKALGIAESGHFALSAKNPNVKGPANATLSKKPAYGKDITKRFGNRAWAEVKEDMLGVENAQFLIIGSTGGVVGEGKSDGAKEHREEDEVIKEEIETLEDEDEARVEALKDQERDALLEELGMGPEQVKSTW
ncbi:MAG: hypothetical protein M1814_001287 [Vezdaea aestivalis]|nr:MAG: hypothetical protein M1814_001287 [Vezdaea aestivalis]